MTCKHTNTTKVMSIPITENGELDYERMSENLHKILLPRPGFNWVEILVCLDCNTVLEKNLVFNPKKV